MNNKILLFQPKSGIESIRPTTPTSLLSLCPGLEERGFEPIIVDTRLKHANYKELTKKYIGESVFVGISTMTGKQISYALKIAQFVRNIAPEIKIVWGGIHPSLLPEQTIEHPLVDIVVVGEGEETVVELTEALVNAEDIRSVKGIFYTDPNDHLIFTGERPLPDVKKLKPLSWHLINVNDYSDITIETSRGCPWRCRYCYNSSIRQRRWRTKSVDQILDELRILKEKYSVNSITFIDDNFFSNLTRVRTLLKKIIEENLNIFWSATSRADNFAKFDEDLVNKLKQSGNQTIFVGSESGSQSSLDYIQKDISVEDILEMARVAEKYNLQVQTGFMLGLPVETEEDRHKTLAIMDRIKEINPSILIVQTYIYTPYPGSEMYNDAIEAGFIPPQSLEEWADFNLYDCQLPWLDPQEKDQLESLAFISRFVFWYRGIKKYYLSIYHYPFYFLLRASALIRWKLRFFNLAWEWKLFRYFVKMG